MMATCVRFKKYIFVVSSLILIFTASCGGIKSVVAENRTVIETNKLPFSSDRIAVENVKDNATVTAALKAGDYDRAIDDARVAYNADPSDLTGQKLAEAYMARAWYYKSKRLTTYALGDLLSAVEAAPNYYLAYYDLGRFYNNQVMQAAAIVELNRCLKLKPDFAPAYNERSACYSRIYKWEAAVADADKAIQLDPQEAAYYYTRSIAWRGMGKKEQAASDLKQVIQLSTDSNLRQKAVDELQAIK